MTSDDGRLSEISTQPDLSPGPSPGMVSSETLHSSNVEDRSSPVESIRNLYVEGALQDLGSERGPAGERGEDLVGNTSAEAHDIAGSGTAGFGQEDRNGHDD